MSGLCAPADPRASTRARAQNHALRFGLAYLALCMALSVACLSFAEQLEKPSVVQRAQADASLLMSCAEEPSSNSEPLWCANPDSPHCTRGTPAPQSGEPWLGPMFAAWAAPRTIPLTAELRAPGARSAAELLGYAHADGERIERPPRHA